MLFNTVTYLVFLAAVVVLYWHLPKRPRLWLIFIASCVFYGFWRVEFIPLLLASAALDYYLALWIERTEDEAKRKRLMIVSVAINIAILAFFKYLIFFKDTIWSIAGALGIELGFVELNIILPLGISFYIFATISYVIDVYRREFEAERDFLVYACFVVFFPHLVAGPILRARSLVPQLRDRVPFELRFIPEGIARIVGGLFLKVFLADSIGEYVDANFRRDAAGLSAWDAWTLAFLFGFQIYFDFAGYSHIAIGSSKLMGIVLPENFNFPYMATSPRDFWRRWHISLSTWIRDYVYLPMADGYVPHKHQAPHAAPTPGLPERRPMRTRSLYVTWALMGLWHGAAWTFVIWGVFHAVCVHGQRIFEQTFGRGEGGQARAVANWAVTLALMMAAWVPFRAHSIEQTLAIWGRMVDPRAYRPSLTLPLEVYVTAAVVMLGIVATYLVHERVLPRLDATPAARFVGECVVYTLAIAGALTYLQIKSQFIYFQF